MYKYFYLIVLYVPTFDYIHTNQSGRFLLSKKQKKSIDRLFKINKLVPLLPSPTPFFGSTLFFYDAFQFGRLMCIENC